VQCRQNSSIQPITSPAVAKMILKRAARQIRPRRDTRKLSLYKIEFVPDRSEVGARLIDVARCERVFVWHAHAR
jgi:hypothetical protein